MTVGKRIRDARKAKGLTQAQLAEKVRLKRNTIANYETDNIEPSERSILDICRVLGASETWLRTGEGEMFLDLGPDAELERIFDLIQASDDQTIRAIVRVYWRLPDEGKKILRQAILDIAEEIKKSQGESPGQ